MQNKESIIHVFDYDGVLFNYKSDMWSFYPNVIELINKLSKTYILAIASRRPGDSCYSQDIIDTLKKMGIYEKFDLVLIADKPKSAHLQEIKKFIEEKYKMKDSLVILYDDLDDNIKNVVAAGFKGILITNGLQEKDIICS